MKNKRPESDYKLAMDLLPTTGGITFDELWKRVDAHHIDAARTRPLVAPPLCILQTDPSQNELF